MNKLLAEMALAAMLLAIIGGCEPAHAQGGFLEGFQRGYNGGYQQQQRPRYHAWIKQATSYGQDAFGNNVAICHWRCTSHNESTTTSGQAGFCPMPMM